tara:strand:- start:1405 stop:1560 length:156 start_codon:yes stop_codon:yes gene_type:complete
MTSEKSIIKNKKREKYYNNNKILFQIAPFTASIIGILTTILLCNFLKSIIQ